MPGEIVHIEIPADDSAASRQFWGSLFGWQFQPFDPSMDYQMARVTDRQGVAVTGMEPGKHGILTYFTVEDINAGAARVKDLGGTAVDPMPVPAMGWFTTCTDPHGNEFGLWQDDPTAPMPG
jgi:predicted enzyme related to lactoylglutathione lyase